MGGRGSSSGKASASGVGSSSSINSSSLPQLQGSEKQVAWAEQLRGNYIQKMNAFLDSDDLSYSNAQLSAQDVMRNLFENGAIDFNTSYSKKLMDDIKAQNPGMSVRQRDELHYDFMSNIVNEASAAYRELKATDKGKAKIAKAKVFKRYAKQFLDYSVSQATSASKWIDRYK